ncbi:methyltransferase domain-containing protein [Sinorhizobium americanum]|uniref:methyltransferase domain-containing protein n=1 Tax=Sinorhizobium americanum TaxID=194963 RepID=UPI00055B73EC|nr:class I SAM-dependent methyltransferase [Sinorhizobium americanum]
MRELDRIRRRLDRSQQRSFPLDMQEFGMQLTVNEGVFPPEDFQSWRWITENFPPVGGKNILEIGCGFGLPGLYLAKHGAQSVLSCDINPKAVANTLQNAARNGIQNVEALESDIFSNIPFNRKFDIIFWNCPSNYVPDDYEYRGTLERGAFDPGYRLLNRFLSEGPELLTQAGSILLGFGSNGRDDIFSEIIAAQELDCKLLASGTYSQVSVTYRLFTIHKKVPGS